MANQRTMDRSSKAVPLIAITEEDGINGIINNDLHSPASRVKMCS